MRDKQKEILAFKNRQARRVRRRGIRKWSKQGDFGSNKCAQTCNKQSSKTKKAGLSNSPSGLSVSKQLSGEWESVLVKFPVNNLLGFLEMEKSKKPES